MLYIAENIKSFRKQKDMTQEEVADILCVSAQSVSKWERGDTYPDITLLPSIANLYNTSVDALIGMDKINDTQARSTVFWEGQKHLYSGDTTGAIEVYTKGLKKYPNDENITMELALVLAHYHNNENLNKAIVLCERLLSSNSSDEVRYITQAALCYIYLKAGDKEKAICIANTLPHEEVSRNKVLTEICKNLSVEEINLKLTHITARVNPEHDYLVVDFGIDMVTIYEKHNLGEKINSLRKKFGKGELQRHIIPHIRIMDNIELLPNQVRVRHCADYILDKCYDNTKIATDEILLALDEVAKVY